MLHSPDIIAQVIFSYAFSRAKETHRGHIGIVGGINEAVVRFARCS